MHNRSLFYVPPMNIQMNAQLEHSFVLGQFDKKSCLMSEQRRESCKQLILLTCTHQHRQQPRSQLSHEMPDGSGKQWDGMGSRYQLLTINEWYGLLQNHQRRIKTMQVKRITNDHVIRIKHAGILNCIFFVIISFKYIDMSKLQRNRSN